jgi:hypothetical protein
MRLGTGIALLSTLFLTAGCGSNLASTPTPLASQQLTSRQMSALEYPQAGRDADDSYGVQPHDVTRRHPVPDKPKRETRNDRSDGLLSPGWAKEEKPEKEDWERQLERKINNVCRGC